MAREKDNLISMLLLGQLFEDMLNEIATNKLEFKIKVAAFTRTPGPTRPATVRVGIPVGKSDFEMLKEQVAKVDPNYVADNYVLAGLMYNLNKDQIISNIREALGPQIPGLIQIRAVDDKTPLLGMRPQWLIDTTLAFEIENGEENGR